jgi:DNA-directed RNA polymerase III subunit RPC6
MLGHSHHRMQSNIQQQALNKIFKNLENRQLIKPVKSVTAKAKKLYMLYDLQPAKEITGGPWYTELEFDHEFVSELRTFVLLCVEKINGGKGVALKEIASKMKDANISRVQLNLSEVQQLVQTLAFDYLIEHNGTNLNGEALFVAAKKCSSRCEFKWWEVLDDDFPFRDIGFEDGVVLSRHEPHYHTAS